jgi:hypothetical protein
MPPTPRIHSDRQFGIEIECFGMSIDTAVEVLRDAGIYCVMEGYNHHTRPHWKIVTDSSVSDGFEVVSPILSGNEGLEDVRKVAQALVRAGAKVDRRCGFHVHVNARDLSGADVLNCIRRYALHESQIDGFMPQSRRGGNNTYCRAMDEVVRAIRNVSESATPLQVAQRIYERYYKLNVQSFARHGTIEFRQHSGTVDYRKMINWIVFCVAFVEDSRAIRVPATANEMPVVEATGTLRRNAVEHKLRRLAEALDRHTDRFTPMSGAALAAAMEVEESSVPSYVSQFRNRYPEVQISARRGMGYYRDGHLSLVDAMNNTRTQPAVRLEPPTEQGVFASLSLDVASYFHERAMDLDLAS